MAPAYQPAEPVTNSLTPARLAAFEGYYDFRGTLTAIRSHDGKLAWIGLDARPVILLPETADTFFYESRDINPDRSWRLRFDTGQISYRVDGRTVFTLAAMGRLCSRLADAAARPSNDDVQKRVDAWLSGDKTLAATGIAPPPGLAGKSLQLLEATKPAVPIERNGHAVAFVYKFATGASPDMRWLVVTADGAGRILSADTPEV